jgi:two-component system sensor histidine kinase KdpD
MIFLLAVVVAALYLGRGPAVLVSILGVLGFDFFFVPPYYTFAVDDTEYILTFTGLLGVGLLISQLTAQVRKNAEAAQRAELFKATERLQAALLNSISHDLRTPLVSITGALSSLAESGPALDPVIRQSLVETAREEADRMNRLVSNLLNMSRLEAGAMQVIKQPGDLQDAIGSALDNLSDRLGKRPINISIPEEFPFIPMDFVLVIQVLVNLLDNAIKYSSPDAPIEVAVRRDGELVQVRVSDRGVGIPPGDLERIFEKFYRVKQPVNVSGSGLGLAICRGIVEAHGGRCWAENRPGGGTVVVFTLPLENAPPAESAGKAAV